MKRFVLLLAFVVCSAFADVDLNKTIAELPLKDGRSLKNVVLVSYSPSVVMAKWDGGRGTIAYEQFPDEYQQNLAATRVKTKTVKTAGKLNDETLPRKSVEPTMTHLELQGLASEIEKKINLIAKFTSTHVFPTKGDTDAHIGLVVVSDKPIFSADKTKIPWLVVAVASVGYALNQNPHINASETWFSDSAVVKQGKAYALPGTFIKDLQRRNKANEIGYEETCSEILKNLVEKTVKI